MATPKNILKATDATTVSYKTVTKKTVVQNINIFNNTGQTLPFSVFRIPSNEIGNPANYTQQKHKVRQSTSIPTNSSITYENLKFVLEAGDTIAVSTTLSGLNFTVFIDGVEFD